MVEIRPVASGRDLDRFLKLPFRLYRDDPNWVPPLLSDLENTLTPGRNPFWNHAERQLFLAMRDGAAVGRIAAIVDRNYNDYHQSKLAIFGYFEAENDAEVAGALLDAVAGHARTRGLMTIYGPANPAINDEVGMLVEPFNSPPMIKSSYNPAYYPRLIEEIGFTKVKDFYAFGMDADQPIPEKYERVVKLLRTRPEIEIRHPDVRDLKPSLDLIKQVYNDAWSRNWDFEPMNDDEIDDLARQLRPLIIPDFISMVMFQGEIAAMSIGLPDYNQVLRKMNGRLFPFGWLTFLIEKGRINQARLWTLGVLHKFRHQGFDALLYYESIMAARKHGFKRGELSMILEDNVPMIRPITNLGARIVKTYRVYQRPV
jgi:GNAT superfamily N-acetyltransferase